MRAPVASKTGNQDIARRYAAAFFDLAVAGGQVDAVSADMKALRTFLAAGDDVSAFLNNPVLRRAQQADVLQAVGAELKLSALTLRFLGTLAMKRRLPQLADIVSAVEGLVAAHKGEVTADVTAAQALDQKQIDAIAGNIKQALGVTVRVNLHVDPAIIGGLVIRVGSRLIDNSVRTKLDRLHRAIKTSPSSSDQKKMKEVA